MQKFRMIAFILPIWVLLSGLMLNVLAHEELPANLSPIYSGEDTIPLMRFGYGWANDIAWSPDGASLAVATSIGVWLYDSANLQAEPVLVNETVFNARAVKYSPDGNFLAAVGSKVYLWNATSHELVRTIDSEDVLDLAFSSDGSRILISHAFDAENFELELWNIRTGEQVAVLAEGVFANLVFSLDGRYIGAVRLSDCCFTSYLWDAATLDTLFSGDIEVRADDERVVFSPDYETFVAMDRTGSFTVLDLQNQATITTITLDTEVEEWNPAEVAFSPDASLLISLSRTGILRIWYTVAYTPVATIDLNWNPSVARLSPDGNQIAAIDRIGSLRIWDVLTGDLVAQRDNFTVNDPVIAFSPDGSLLASGATNGEIWLWDIANGEPLFVLEGHEDRILSLDFSSDGAFLASASEDGSVRLWDIAARTLSRIIAEGDYSTVIIDSQNQVLIADENRIQIHDLISNEPILWFHDSDTDSYSSEHEIELGIKAIAFENNQLAVATFGQILLWERNTNGTQDVTRGLSRPSINTVTFAAIEDSFALVYAANNVVLQWSGEGTRILTPHNSWIYALASNGQVLASGGCAETKRSPWDGSPYCAGAELRLWDYTYESYSDVSQEQGHTAPIRDTAFNSAGTLLATISDDGTILLWANLSSNE